MNLLIAGGGTGGHVYPALAVAEAAAKADPPHQTEFVGSPQGVEANLVARAGYTFHAAPSNPLPRKWSVHSVAALTRFCARVPLSTRLLRRLNPDVVLGTGGYVSATILFAASLLRLPTIMLDINALPGRTTRYLARRVSRLALGFAEARQYLPADKSVFAGIPVRKAILAADRDTSRRKWGLEEAHQMLLVFGGSQAAHRINLAVFDSLEELLTAQRNLRLVHLCGEKDLPLAEERLSKLGEGKDRRYRPMDYCHEMDSLLPAADLVVCRSGGASVGELTARGLPAILVPYPYATDNHQEANARSVEAATAARVVLDADLDGPAFLRETTSLLTDESRLAAMRSASLHYSHPDAASKVVQLAEGLAKRA
ncbi:MAG: UDP-N-acetylglucosamine--N-acetylmuramyl-(pentapeptide) pyrophosphoryl-undecaprenol N-acetylglucosamine transferase [Armatimonadetes bacterium]|nr:UDP-N-acetylglucosamine--N-acetylmuramyl-(pentapeptide) pyrophosphoryl-undecaprenol N-acetylglucosamine transferase [Armatimonadota bacterium]